MSGVNKTMNKASQGIIEIDGYDFSKKTTIDKVRTLGKFEFYEAKDKKEITHPTEMSFSNKIFVVSLTFFNGLLCGINMYPSFLDDEEGELLQDKHAAAFDVCKKALDEYFEDNAVISNHKNWLKYRFKGGYAILPYSYYDDKAREYITEGYFYVVF